MKRIPAGSASRPVGCLPGVVLFCLLLGTLAHAQQTDQPPVAVSQIPLPEGPYASWPEEAKGKALAALAFRCSLVSVMQLGAYQGPSEAASEYSRVLAMACIDRQMPGDWPGRLALRQEQQRRFELAHQLDDQLAMPPGPDSAGVP